MTPGSLSDRSRTPDAKDDEIDALRIERDSARTVVKEAYAEVRRLRGVVHTAREYLLNDEMDAALVVLAYFPPPEASK